MTQKQKIEQLEKEVAELKMKVQLLEARPMIITVAHPLPYVAQPQPWSQPGPWSPSGPYVGDPVYPTITGGTGTVCSAAIPARRNVMSSASNLVQ